MTIHDDLRIDVFDPDRVWTGRLGEFISLEGTLRHSSSGKPGSMTLTVAADCPLLDALMDDAARISITLRGTLVFSGSKDEGSGGLLMFDKISLLFTDDTVTLDEAVAWVAPHQQISPTRVSVEGTNDPTALAQAWLPGGGSDQGTSGTTRGQYPYFVFPDGSAQWGGWNARDSYESAIKAVVSMNAVNRLGLPLQVQPSQGRGGVPTTLPPIRMSTIREAIQPMLDASGLSLTMLQRVGQTATFVDVEQPQTWQAPLTVDSKIVQGGSWKRTRPSCTRVVVGGQGDMADRAFFTARDATGLEQQFGRVVELFKDATGGQMKWPEGLDDALKVAKYYLLRGDVSAVDKAAYQGTITESGNKALNEGRPETVISAELAETDAFQLAGEGGIQLGDRVTIVSAAGVQYTDRISGAKISATNSKGLKVTPLVGEATEDAQTVLATAVSRLAGSLRRMSSNR